MKFFFLIAFVVAVVFLVIRWQATQYESVVANSEQVGGVVVAQYQRVIDPKNQRQELQVEYRYTARGIEHTATETVEYPDIWQTMTPDSTVLIYVDRRDATRRFLVAPMDRRLSIARKTGAAGQ